MSDSRKISIYDRERELDAVRREGFRIGELRAKIQTFQEWLRIPVGSEDELEKMDLKELELLKNSLQEKWRSRLPS
jgi:hypothetical protein